MTIIEGQTLQRNRIPLRLSRSEAVALICALLTIIAFITLDWLEETTGLRLLSALPPNLQSVLQGLQWTLLLIPTGAFIAFAAILWGGASPAYKRWAIF